jgi:hypothetical protein
MVKSPADMVLLRHLTSGKRNVPSGYEYPMARCPDQRSVLMIYPAIYHRCEYAVNELLRGFCRSSESIFDERIKNRLRALGFSEVEVLKTRMTEVVSSLGAMEESHF